MLIKDVVSSSKLKKLTGFKPEINLNEGLIKTLKYIKENEKFSVIIPIKDEKENIPIISQK